MPLQKITSGRHVAGIEGYDPTTGCVTRDDIAIRYLGKPESILSEVTSAGFQVLDVATTKGDNSGDIIIQAVKAVLL